MRIIFFLKVHYEVCSLILFPLFVSDVMDSDGKFTADVVDTGGNLPPVLLILVVHLDLRISKMIHETNLKQKIS
jgi:hypothetical protein